MADPIQYLTNLLEKNNIEVWDQYAIDEAYVICTEKMLMSYTPEINTLSVSFHVITPPADVYNMSENVLQKINGMEITCSDVFVMTENRVLTGAEAIKHYDAQMKAKYTKEFIEEQRKQHMLCFMEGHEC